MKVVDISTSTVDQHEICTALCSLRGSLRKIICMGAYLTTALDLAGSEAFLQHLNDLLHSFKAKYRDPYIIVTGDWNKADTSIALDDFPSLQAVLTPLHEGR